MKYPVALLIGRFQPFHLGHLYLLKKTLEISDKVIIGIGSANINDDNNPIDYDTRRKIIKAVFYKEKIEEKLVKIVPLDDFFNDKKWLNNIKKQVGSFDLVVGNNEWTNKILERAHYDVKTYPYYKRQLYEGWRIRKLIRDGKSWEDRVPDYLVSKIKILLTKFQKVVLGGTFDHFHKGHEELIKKAFEIGEKVIIGIAKEKLYKNKLLSEAIESFNSRKKSVSDFLIKKGWLNRAKLISFADFKGGADKSKDIDAMVVSRLTYPNALRINELRKKNKLKPLLITVIKDVLTEDGTLLSSERIRTGEIDREGRIYLNYFKKTLIMPENLREKLRKPLGKVFKGVHKVIKFIKFIKPIKVIAVGDIIVDSLLKNGVEPDVKVIDFRSRREILPNVISSATRNLAKRKFINQPGTINFETAEKLDNLIKKGQRWLVVDGEEDLLALPAILLAPLNSLILYGHWQLGIIVVEVTEKTKEKIITLIKKFD
ncbi:pantetheine-phosphate adenylyltransferase [Candidatus Roizmanbacteria bacterium]|nr:pantetheine-phosphate adenylyltransferase [Candidatus Roizmanbacteria bacterium]